MPVVFGEPVSSVEEIVRVFTRCGDAVRGRYRVRYVFDRQSKDPYRGATLERPLSLSQNPADALYPWEQIFMAAANCAGSDYPMLAAHFHVPIERVELVVEGIFDPRGAFDGLHDFHAPPDAAPCYLSIHLHATLDSPAPNEALHMIHDRVMSTNMVLGALRGIPRTAALEIRGRDDPAAAAPPRCASTRRFGVDRR
jgi:hypothetical protein